MANTYYDSQLTAAEIEAVLEAINGILSPANNGKVLAISNGKFEARSVQWGGGGGAVVQPLSVTQNGTYNPPSGVDGYAPVVINVSGGGAVIQPDYSGASYGFLYNNDYYGNPSIIASVCYFEIPAGNYAIFQNDAVGNRFRFAFFSNKTFSDFENYIESPSPNALIYTSDFGYANDQYPNCRYLFTVSTSGVVALTVNNTGSTANSAILVKL
jgi:hypothetical protein